MQKILWSIFRCCDVSHDIKIASLAAWIYEMYMFSFKQIFYMLNILDVWKALDFIECICQQWNPLTPIQSYKRHGKMKCMYNVRRVFTIHYSMLTTIVKSISLEVLCYTVYSQVPCEDWTKTENVLFFTDSNVFHTEFSIRWYQFNQA